MGRVVRKKNHLENSENTSATKRALTTKSIVRAVDKHQCLIGKTNKRMALTDKTNAVGQNIECASILRYESEDGKCKDEDICSKKPVVLPSNENVASDVLKSTVSCPANRSRRRKGLRADGKSKENVLPAVKISNSRSLTREGQSEESTADPHHLRLKDYCLVVEEEHSQSENETSPTTLTKPSPIGHRSLVDQAVVVEETPVASLDEDCDCGKPLEAYENEYKTPQRSTQSCINDTKEPTRRSSRSLSRKPKSKYDNDEWLTDKSTTRLCDKPATEDMHSLPTKASKKNIATNKKNLEISHSSVKTQKISHCSSNKATKNQCQSKNATKSPHKSPRKVPRKGFLQRIAEKVGESVIVDESLSLNTTEGSAAKSRGLSSDLPSLNSKASRVEGKRRLLTRAKSKMEVTNGSKEVGAAIKQPMLEEEVISMKATSQPKTTSSASKLPSTPHSRLSTNLFSIFKRPDTPRRGSMENKIFVSNCNDKPSFVSNTKPQPVYADPKMTPLRRKSRAIQEIDGLYEFEVDENEPRPVKKQRRIMKIQRLRPTKKKQKRGYVEDPEMEMKVLRTLELSPSVLNIIKGPLENKNCLPASNPIQNTLQGHEDHNESADDGHMSDGHVSDDDFDPFNHKTRLGMKSSTPYTDRYSHSSPVHSFLGTPRHSTLDVSAIDFQGVPARAYSPVKSKDSPIPVFLANQHDTEKSSCAESVKSFAGNDSVVFKSSCSSMCPSVLDAGASTPIKRYNNESTVMPNAELNLSNCFGFDEPGICEEPLASHIKADRLPSHQPSTHPLPILKKKPVLAGPPLKSCTLDVGEVIKQLRFEVGEESSANASHNVTVFEDTVDSPIKKSPLKRFLQSKHVNYQESEMNNSTIIEVPPISKKPRLSYERPRLRKRVINKSFILSDSDSESGGTSDEEDESEEQPKLPKKLKPSTPKKKKGMTKKEEEELEKWAKMFNSQCEQVESYGLCVE